MSETIARKLLAARTLHEVWNAPFDLLDQVLGRVAGSVQRKSLEEGWASSGLASAAPLHRQLIEIFDGELGRFDCDQQCSDVEKRARALSVLAKTLETIAAVGAKLAVNSADRNNKQNGRSDDAQDSSHAGTIEDLDRQLAQLVGNLVSDGEME